MRASRTVIAAVAALTVVTGAGLAWRASTAPVADPRPVTMPATFMDLTPRPNSFDTQPTWTSMARKDLGEAGFAGASYGQPGVSAWVNVVAARTDTTGLLDLRMAGDEGQLIGNTRCTENVVLRTNNQDDDTPASELTRMTGKLLCWRTSERLSVTAFVYAAPPAPDVVATAVDALWVSLS